REEARTQVATFDAAFRRSNEAILAFNERLKTAVPDSYRSRTIVVDLHALFNRLQADPEYYGLQPGRQTDAEERAHNSVVDLTDTYRKRLTHEEANFTTQRDGVHPTEAVYRLVAKEFASVISTYYRLGVLDENAEFYSAAQPAVDEVAPATSPAATSSSSAAGAVGAPASSGASGAPSPFGNLSELWGAPS
ncbi:MAG: hypothetical protein AAF721_02415, partial [Myxococcota bacterium]